MDKKTYDRGREIRARVLGEESVRDATAGGDEFTKPSRRWPQRPAGPD